MNNNFTTIEATYRIVTPMFCSGSDQQHAELRLASFKGALRFWWRSLMWGQVSDIKDLQKKEAATFGSSNQKVGQSKVRMRLLNNQTHSPSNKAEWSKNKGIQYLGYGVMNHKGELNRPMIPGGIFTVELRLAASLDDEQRQQVKNALILLGTVGGLGSKSRKGFGSLTLTELKINREKKELATCPAERIKEMTKSLGEGQPQWTAWSQQSRMLLVTNKGKSSIELLDQIGKEQVYYRSWGNRGRVIDRAREANFKEDHDLSKRQHVAIKHPKRIAFGLPHNYGKGDSNAVVPDYHDLERRASPLFLHIHLVSESSQPIGVAVFMPSRFLPENEKIRAFGNNVPLDSSQEFWNPVNSYLDRLIDKNEATKKVQKDLQAEEITVG